MRKRSTSVPQAFHKRSTAFHKRSTSVPRALHEHSTSVALFGPPRQLHLVSFRGDFRRYGETSVRSVALVKIDAPLKRKHTSWVLG